MRVRHREDGPETARSLGVMTSAGDTADVSKGIGRRLIQRRWYDPADGVCTERTADGVVCGEDTPCQYHGAGGSVGDDDGDGDGPEGA